MSNAVAMTAGDQLAVLAHKRHVYVIPQYKLMFVSIAKNACTSIKWVMAELAGEDLSTFKLGLLPFMSDDHAVHVRSRFKKALRVDQVDLETRAQIHPANGWFIFSVVRDPRARLFSAWQDKLLLQDAVYLRHRRNPWYPEFSTEPAVIAAEFARFVDAMSAQPALALHHDRHFDSQANLLRLDAVPYSKIYPIEQMSQLEADLTEHLRRQGWHGTLTFRRSNDTPLRANAAVFAGDVRAKIEQLYAADFEAFGHLWDYAKIEQTPEWSNASLQELRLRRAFGLRLGEVRAIANTHRKRHRKLTKRVAQLEREVRQLRRRGGPTGATAATAKPGASALRRLARRLRRRLRTARK